MVAFFVSMEWTGQQQIQFLLQSVVLGCILGALLDVVTGLVRIAKHRRYLWTDIMFGPVAAVVTFLGALVIMDGQLHPVLFVGIALGMAAEHRIVGRGVSRIIRLARRGLLRLAKYGCLMCRAGVAACVQSLFRLFQKRKTASEKKENP